MRVSDKGSGSYPPHNNKQDNGMIEIDKINDRTLYTTEETAKILGVSTRSVTNYRVAGKLEGIRGENRRFCY